MQRPSPWIYPVVLLLGLLVMREPRWQSADDFFLRWQLRNSQQRSAKAPLTIIDIGRERTFEKNGEMIKPLVPLGRSDSSSLSPLEYALFLQSLMEFHPNVVAVEPILKWRESDHDQEQVFIDQAMRVPKLLMGALLTDTPDLDLPGQELPALKNVTGKRTDLPSFSGIERQPDEELRIISKLGFVNAPAEVSDDLRVPLLFVYRGEVIPSFPLQAVMLWLGLTPGEVKVDLGSHISLPGNRTIPIQRDGTLIVNSNAAAKARRITFNEMLLAAQQREAAGPGKAPFADMQETLVLARRPDDPLSPPEGFANAIASIQTNSFVRRVGWWFDALILAAAMVCVWRFGQISKGTLLLGAIAFSAAYGFVALAVVSRFATWLPGLLPLGILWSLVLLRFVWPRALALAQKTAATASAAVAFAGKKRSTP